MGERKFKVFYTVQKTYEVTVRDDQVFGNEDIKEVAEELAPIQGKLVFEDWDTDEIKELSQ